MSRDFSTFLNNFRLLAIFALHILCYVNLFIILLPFFDFYDIILWVIKMKLIANAKINLTLDVVNKRSDGYHNVKMIMQSLEFGDEITICKAESGIHLSGSEKSLAYDGTNLAYKSAELFFSESKINGGAKIHIEKKIPICAGLAGGSSDAAAVLVALNDLYGKPFESDILSKLGSRLGADVPFCIAKGTMLAEGIGEILTPLAPLPQKNVLLVKPPIDISTPWAYKSLNLETMPHPKTDLAAEYISSKKTAELYDIMGNIFEHAVFCKYPVAGDIKRRMKEYGANAALMSGSGPTIFGIFENENFAKTAYNKFKSEYNDTFLTKTFNV